MTYNTHCLAAYKGSDAVRIIPNDVAHAVLSDEYLRLIAHR